MCISKRIEKLLKISSSPASFTVSISPSGPMWDNDVFISCNVTPMPYGASVWWMLNNSPFVKQSKITLNHNITKSVVREKVTVRLTGNWTCVVSYRGEVGKASVSLTPKGKNLNLIKQFSQSECRKFNILLSLWQQFLKFSSYTLSQESSNHLTTILKCMLLWDLQPHSPVPSPLV